MLFIVRNIASFFLIWRVGSTSPKLKLHDRNIYESREEEATEDWKRLHGEELHDLYSSANIIRVIESRRMRMAEHVARMGDSRITSRFWWHDLREIDQLENLGVDGTIILKLIFMN
jgi:hypothetical protein